MLNGVIPMLPTPFNYEKDIIFETISNHSYLKSLVKLNKISILFKKIEKKNEN